VASRLTDGVRVRVEVPAEIKAAMKSTNDTPVRQAAQERLVVPAPSQVAGAPKTVRIVEFDAEGRRKGGGRP
jgi:hypothetical protein